MIGKMYMHIIFLAACWNCYNSIWSWCRLGCNNLLIFEDFHSKRKICI